MKALITGVGGFCGMHLVARLRQEAGLKIAGLSLSSTGSTNIKLDRYFSADVTDSRAVDRALRQFRPDLLFHLAGLPAGQRNVSQTYAVNVIGTVNILESVRRNCPKCAVVITGSAAEYGPVARGGLPVTERTVCRPVGPYGLSKYAATLVALDYARRYDIRVSVVRPFNIVGPGVPDNLVIGALLSRAKRALSSRRPVVKIGDVSSERDFVHVADAVHAYVRIAELGLGGEIFNICSGRAHSIGTVARMLLANSPRHIAIKVDPGLVCISPARTIYGSYEKAAKAIGFRPSRSLDVALKDAWAAYIGPVEATLGSRFIASRP